MNYYNEILGLVSDIRTYLNIYTLSMNIYVEINPKP